MVKKLKFKVGRDEPEDLPEFKTNAEIGKPPRGLYRFRIVKLEMKTNSSKDDMLKIHTVIDEKDKKKSKWNGYYTVTNQNVTEVGAPYLKRFLVAIGTTWAKFLSDTTGEPEGLVQKLGGIKVDSVKRPVYVYATTADDKYEGEERLVVARWVKPQSRDEAEEPGDTDAGDDDLPDDDDVEVESDDDEGDEGEEEADGFDEDELREELEDVELKDLKKLARTDYGLKASAYKDMDEDELRDLIVETASEQAESAEEDEGEEGEEESDDEPDDDLDELDLPELKKRARAVGIKVKEYKGKSEDELKDMIRERGDEPPF